MSNKRAAITLTFNMDVSVEYVQRVAHLIDDLERIPGVRVESTITVDGVTVDSAWLQQNLPV
jgi:hypothetical protein